MLFESEIEKELWRQAAVAALNSVADAKTPEHREAMTYATFVADGIVRAYRKRCDEKNDE